MAGRRSGRAETALGAALRAVVLWLAVGLGACTPLARGQPAPDAERPGAGSWPALRFLGFAFSPDSRFLYFSARHESARDVDYRLLRFDLTTQETTTVNALCRHRVTYPVMSDDGRLIAVDARDGTAGFPRPVYIGIVDAHTSRARLLDVGKQGAKVLQYFAQGSHTLVFFDEAISDEPFVREVDVDTGTVRNVFPDTGAINFEHPIERRRHPLNQRGPRDIGRVEPGGRRGELYLTLARLMNERPFLDLVGRLGIPATNEVRFRPTIYVLDRSSMELRPAPHAYLVTTATNGVRQIQNLGGNRLAFTYTPQHSLQTRGIFESDGSSVRLLVPVDYIVRRFRVSPDRRWAAVEYESTGWVFRNAPGAIAGSAVPQLRVIELRSGQALGKPDTSDIAAALAPARCTSDM